MQGESEEPPCRCESSTSAVCDPNPPSSSSGSDDDSIAQLAVVECNSNDGNARHRSLDDTINNNNNNSDDDDDDVSVLSSCSRKQSTSVVVDDQEESQQSLKAKFLEVWFRYSCLEPEDDFGQVMRKSSATLHLLMSPGPFAFGLYFVKLGYFPDDPPEDESSLLGVRGTAIFGPLWTFHAMLPYIVLRWKRHITTQFSDMHIVGHVLCLLFCTVFYPACLVQALTIATAILAILNQTKYETIHCFVLSIVFAIVSFNRTYLGTGHELTVPGAYTGNPLENAINAVVCGTVVFVGIAGVFPQSIANRKHIAAAKAAVAMCARIVVLLGSYDTEGATSALEEYDESRVDPELIMSMQVMNANLESYRPFLPNYLFQDDDSEEVQSGLRSARTTGATQSEDMTVAESTLSSIMSMSQSCAVVEIEKSRKNSDIVATTEVAQDAPLSLPSPSSFGRRHSRGSSGPSSRRSSVAVRTMSPRSVFEGNVTLVLVEVPQFHAAKKPRAVATSFVELIYAAADQFKGSVHSMAGSVATITWNATHRLPQPEVKAVRFLNHLKKHQDNNFKFGGVAFSGPATCYSVTTAGKQHAHLVSSQWMPMLNTAFTLACQHKSLLMDERTEAASAHHFGSLFVDRVALLDGNANKSPLAEEFPGMLILPHCHPDNLPPTHTRAFLRATSLFELTHEVVVEETEWMYQLQSKDEKQNGASLLRDAGSTTLDAVMGVMGRPSLCCVEEVEEDDTSCNDRVSVAEHLKVTATKTLEVLIALEESESKNAANNTSPPTTTTNDDKKHPSPLLSRLPLFRRLKSHITSMRYAVL